MRRERIVITVTCDHCPADNPEDVAGTYTVGYGASQYELDLCATHKSSLDKTIAGITTGARRIAQTAASKKEEKKFRDDARAWARENGRKVSNIGIISTAIMDDYREHLRGQVT